MKAALITGASRGIGRAIARQLASEGYFIYGGYKWREDYQDEKAEADDLKHELTNVELLPYDFADRRNTAELVKRIKDVRLDAIINNAGEVLFDEWPDINFDNWDRILEVNLTAPLFIVSQLQHNLNDNSAVVNISSTDGLSAAYDTFAYAVSKSAIMNLTQSLAAVLGPRGIRVNAVAPGWVETDMTKDTMPPESKELTPLGRNAQPQDVATAVSFLLSDKASFINGITLPVDGGLTAVDYTLYKESHRD